MLDPSRMSVPPPAPMVSPPAAGGYGSTSARPYAAQGAPPPPPQPMHARTSQALPVSPPVAPAPQSRAPEDAVARTQYYPNAGVQERVVGVLVGIEGRLAGELYALRDGDNTLGRDPKCEVRFPERDPRISRRHALIVHSGGMFAIKPLSAENPTLVNQQRIDEVTELSDGAEVAVGASEFRFRTV